MVEEVFKRYPYATEEKNFKRDFAMIQRDFPKLTQKELKVNDSLIMRYYDVNLDYEVLQILKKTRKPIKVEDPTDSDHLLRVVPPDDGPNNRRDPSWDKRRKKREAERRRQRLEAERRRREAKEREKTNCVKRMTGYQDENTQIDCVKNKLWDTSGWAPYLKGCYAAYKMHARLKGVGYTLSLGKLGLVDALRHMWMQGLLCKYYHVGNSKTRRMNFAESVGIFWEECGVNNADASEMDLHNNKIGRDIFNRLTRTQWQQVSFWGLFWYYEPVIHPPADWRMRQEAEKLLNKKGNVLYVAEEITEDEYKGKYPNYKKLSDKICYHKHWIKYEADKNKPVVLKK